MVDDGAQYDAACAWGIHLVETGTFEKEPLTNGGEILFRTSAPDCDGVFDSWRNSPPDYGIATDPKMITVGIACVNHPDGTGSTAVGRFGSP